ncbi:helix-turn-helix transcriptional regulator [Bowmanella yangjiangensis]|uniref:YafY family transcriptional regulator n=1 Tax=Bowmanella yangjiangensis TaxID=2811230 RepID=A0ABS3CMS5_9ALTE|nr:YafY family protein [Bowmanella yangjiangensis]MBN7818412.1 YafY family transcriptional regulator [Bowmanella yangjiangensis]
MRASRLLSILITLQAKGRVTARQLADECQVSVRTIYRDMDALSSAGIPVYSERGVEGGYLLVAGHRTQLNGLSGDEAEALFMLGLAGQAADLGLGSAVSDAQLKLLAALPAAQRSGAERMSNRFHLDAPAWFSEADQPPYLATLADAVRNQHKIRVRYRSWKAENVRVIAPLGLVQKSGQWYLAGQVEEDVRTYRVARMLELEVLSEHFTRPPDFNLPAYWQQSLQRMEDDLYNQTALVKISPQGRRWLKAFLSSYQLQRCIDIGEPDCQGWQRMQIPVGSVFHSASELLRLGAELEVLSPEALRTQMQQMTMALAKLYSCSGK